MKKSISRSLVTLLAIAVFVSSATAQELAHNSKKGEATFTGETRDSSNEIRRLNDVNGKVLKSFYRSFGEKPGATWFKNGSGYVVRFKDQKQTTNVYFSSNGVIDYKVNYYFEDRLSEDVRHTVKSNFYDYSITHVTEVHKDDVICYFIKVEGKTSVKTVRVVGEEWSVVEDLTRR